MDLRRQVAKKGTVAEDLVEVTVVVAMVVARAAAVREVVGAAEAKVMVMAVMTRVAAMAAEARVVVRVAAVMEEAMAAAMSAKGTMAVVAQTVHCERVVIVHYLKSVAAAVRIATLCGLDGMSRPFEASGTRPQLAVFSRDCYL